MGLLIVSFVSTLIAMPIVVAFAPQVAGGGWSANQVEWAFAPSLILSAPLVVRRLHDVGLPVWFALPFFAVYGLTFFVSEGLIGVGLSSVVGLLMVLLFVWPGQTAANRFGAPS